ncbi:hypothetical protein [Streptomyces sp. NPDC056549]
MAESAVQLVLVVPVHLPELALDERNSSEQAGDGLTVSAVDLDPGVILSI